MKPIFIYAYDTLEIRYVVRTLKEVGIQAEANSNVDSILKFVSTIQPAILIPLDRQSFLSAQKSMTGLRKTELRDPDGRSPVQIMQEYLDEADLIVVGDPIQQLETRELLTLFQSTDDAGLKQQYHRISKKDREIRGIPAEAEVAAKVSLSEYSLHEITTSISKEKCLLVHAQTPHFIAIIDRCILEYDHILIYDDYSMVYIGSGVPRLAHFKIRLQESFSIYSGGNSATGYMGIARDENVISGEIRRWTMFLWDHIKAGFNNDVTHTFISGEEVYSTHIFLFPFRAKCRRQDNVEGKWEKMETDWSAISTYNNSQYFLPFVHEFLFPEPPVQSDDGSAYFERKQFQLSPEEGKYVIYPQKDEQNYSLDIISVQLHLLKFPVKERNYEDEVIGVLSFHCENRDAFQSRPVDILRINQFGRRLFPPFLIPIGNLDKSSNISRGIETAHRLKVMGQVHEFKVDNITFNKTDYPLPGFITGLLRPYEQIKPVIDDRMYVICWYGNDGLSEDVSNDSQKESYYAKHDWWYSFVFIDKPGERTVRDPEMWKQLSLNSTYTRWSEYKTWYGVSSYSNVMLTKGKNSLRSLGAGYLPEHFGTLYFEIAKIALMQYIGIIHFMNEVRYIDTNNIGSKNSKYRLNKLRRDFEYYKNHVHQTLISTQVQAIELYGYHQRQFRIKELLADLESDILRFQEYMRVESQQQEEASQRREEKNLALLTRLASIITLFAVVPAFITGFLGMNVFGTDLKPMPDYLWFASGYIVVMIAVGVVVMRLFNSIQKNSKVIESPSNIEEGGREIVVNNRFRMLLGLCIIIFCLTIAYPYFRHFSSKSFQTPSQEKEQVLPGQPGKGDSRSGGDIKLIPEVKDTTRQEEK